MKLSVVTGALVALAGCSAARQTSPNWIVGVWVQEREGRVHAEAWERQDDATFVGVGCMTVDGAVRFRERMTIERRDGGWAFRAAPGGQDPTEFAGVDSGPESIVFENRTHDWPQRIEYGRAGDTLQAVAAGRGDSGEKRSEWTYRKATVSPCGD